MKFKDKRFSIIYALIIGLFITPGLVIIFWQFQILSYMRLLKFCFSLFPISSFIVYIFITNFKITIFDFLQKKSLGIVPLIFAISLFLTRFESDPIRNIITLSLVFITLYFTTQIIAEILQPINKKYIYNTFYYLLFVIGFIGVLIFIYMAFYSRLYADDFCFTYDVKTFGYLYTIANFYMTWSGRIFSDLFMFGFSSVRLMPLIEIILFVLITFLSLKILSSQKQSGIKLWTLSLAVFIPFAIFSIIPDPYKSLYWITNTELIFPVSLVYIIFLSFIVNGFIKGFKHKYLSIIAAFTMSLAITNGHEIMAPAMVMICAFSFTYSLANHNSQKSHQIKVSVGVLAGSLIGILILFGAPGNYARMEAQNYPPMPNIINAIKMSSGFYSIYLSKLLDNWNWVIFIALFFSGLFANTILPKNWTSFLITTLMIIGASWGTFLISTFAISETLPTRTQFIPSLFLVFGFFALGAIIPFQNQKFGILISASLLVFLFSISFPKIISRDYQLIAPIVQFAHDWDIREYDIKVNGVAPYIIPIPWESSEQGFSCVSLYYSR